MSQQRYPFIPFRRERLAEEEMLRRARDYYAFMDERRTVRHFSTDPVPRELIELAIKTASTAPSGAHRQPWHFVAVDDPEIKKTIREAAEEEEKISYEGGRMPLEWREALAPLGTDWRKPHLTDAPWLVVAFEELHGLNEDGSIRKNYYVRESVGLACGLFISAVHHMGLVTLTHTPSPMKFLNGILGRPKYEKPLILFPVGYPAPDAQVPDLQRKGLEEVSTWNPKPPDSEGG